MNQDNTVFDKALKKIKKQYNNLIFDEAGKIIINNKRINLLVTLPVDLDVDGSKNGLKLNGIGKFSFNINDLTDGYIFAIENQTENEIELIIISRIELLNRLSNLNYSEPNQINIRFWITDRGIFETYGIGTEYEFMGLWIDEKREYYTTQENDFLSI